MTGVKIQYASLVIVITSSSLGSLFFSVASFFLIINLKGADFIITNLCSSRAANCRGRVATSMICIMVCNKNGARFGLNEFGRTFLHDYLCKG